MIREFVVRGDTIARDQQTAPSKWLPGFNGQQAQPSRWRSVAQTSGTGSSRNRIGSFALNFVSIRGYLVTIAVLCFACVSALLPCRAQRALAGRPIESGYDLLACD